MLRENAQFNNEQKENKDLNNEDYIRKVFEGGTKEELDQIANHHKFSTEQIERFCYFSKLRREILNEMKEQLAARRENNPLATEAELSMGVYQENIEPQIRETVINLRKKGYASYESGFSGFDSQAISFEKKYLENFRIPDQIIDKFRDQGVTIEISPNRIELIFTKEFNQKEINNFWREIETYFSDLGESAQPCQTRQAVLFRERQKNLLTDK